jgi:DNA-binding FadR family transcriptional regulator
MRKLSRRRTLSEEVQYEIKNYIIRHNLRPGDQLPPETELSHQLGISRNAVREGVKRLESLGILDARPGAGLFVRPFSFEPILDNLDYRLLMDAKQITDLMDVRAFLETAITELVVETITPEQIEKLHELLDEWEDNVDHGLPSDALDRRFHRILVEHLDNQILSELLDLFWLMVHRARRWTSRRGVFPEPADHAVNYQQHLRICQAIEAGDVETAHRYYAAHFARSRQRWQRAQQVFEEERGLLQQGESATLDEIAPTDGGPEGTNLSGEPSAEQ